VCGLKDYYSVRSTEDDNIGGKRSLNMGYREIANSINLEDRDVL
jgi:hypothetical protein